MAEAHKYQNNPQHHMSHLCLIFQPSHTSDEALLCLQAPVAERLPSHRRPRQGEDPLRLRNTKSYMTYNYYKDSGRKRYWLVSHGSGDWLESHCCCCSKLLIKKQTTTIYNSHMAFHCAQSVHCSATLPTGCRGST